MFHYKDQFVLHISSGSGGQGCLSFYSKKIKPRGGPDGGDGGSGGDLILQVSPKVKGFEHLRSIKHYVAGSGGPGGKNLKTGKRGRSLRLDLPMGTLIRNKQGEILKDLINKDTQFCLKGGKGGRGNAFFKTSLNQAPRQFQKGEKGKSQTVILELKPIAQIALIGKVNTGKSSFFNLVTKAKSKVAAYPYTTLAPHVGQLKDLSLPCFIMDIPGLDKGASKSMLKGLSFLRSIQRADLLLYFLDSCSKNFLQDKKDVEGELKLFDKKQRDNSFEGLSQKNIFFILSKTDQLKSNLDLNRLIKKISLKKNQKLFVLSNKTKQGLKELVSVIEESFTQNF